jgi:hypothetical protein
VQRAGIEARRRRITAASRNRARSCSGLRGRRRSLDGIRSVARDHEYDDDEPASKHRAEHIAWNADDAARRPRGRNHCALGPGRAAGSCEAEAILDMTRATAIVLLGLVLLATVVAGRYSFACVLVLGPMFAIGAFVARIAEGASVRTE